MASIFYLSALCLALFPLQGFALETSEKLLFEKNSLYQYISVIENTVTKERYIRNQKRELIQGGIYVNAPDKLLFEFTQLGFVSLAFLNGEPKDVLFVGLGAGVMPRYFTGRYSDAVIDIAEIDPDMVAVAQKYFYFKENERMKVHVEDGRLFVKRTRKKYDWIILDAYQNDYIPFHLTTLEFLKEVKSRLKDNGVVVANITAPFRNKFFDSMVMTYKKAFPHFVIFKGEKSINFIFVATTGSKIRDKDSVEARARKIQPAGKFDIDLEDFASRYEPSETYEWGGAKILTDDFAPVNLYQHQKSGAQ
ncbi:MAG: fused MFS/spermidine synthase [Nitrospiraceae bacterium]|nr:fused MFS/spermidine synthase [Nitrospiraceae bacterium]